MSKPETKVLRVMDSGANFKSCIVERESFRRYVISNIIDESTGYHKSGINDIAFLLLQILNYPALFDVEILKGGKSIDRLLIVERKLDLTSEELILEIKSL